VSLLELFDAPRMEINCIRRTEATVPAQALTLLHSPQLELNAKALAERVLEIKPPSGGDESAADAARVAQLYKLCFARGPSSVEQAEVSSFVAAVVAATLGEKAASATAEERAKAREAAWTQLALVLLNSNEFIYVR
jgi:hypothetical protein